MEKSLPETGGGPVATAFLKRYLDDLRAGHPRSLAEYQALFPGHEQEIAAEYARLAAEEEPEAPGAVPGGARACARSTAGPEACDRKAARGRARGAGGRRSLWVLIVLFRRR